MFRNKRSVCRTKCSMSTWWNSTQWGKRSASLKPAATRNLGNVTLEWKTLHTDGELWHDYIYAEFLETEKLQRQGADLRLPGAYDRSENRLKWALRKFGGPLRLLSTQILGLYQGHKWKSFSPQMFNQCFFNTLTLFSNKTQIFNFILYLNNFFHLVYIEYF